MQNIRRVLRIESKGDEITLRVLFKKRFDHHGFGTFLVEVEPGEISISQEAKDAILRCRYLHGLQGMEIFANKVLAWGALADEIVVNLNTVSLHQGAAKWFNECCVVEDCAAIPPKRRRATKETDST